MCKCDKKIIEEVGYGTLYNTIVLKVPNYIKITYNCDPLQFKTHITVDKCIAEEIKMLWKEGIITRGCCCGHNIHTGFINVDETSIEKMKYLGYDQYIFKNDPNRNDTFIPKYELLYNF